MAKGEIPVKKIVLERMRALLTMETAVKVIQLDRQGIANLMECLSLVTHEIAHLEREEASEAEWARNEELRNPRLPDRHKRSGHKKT